MPSEVVVGAEDVLASVPVLVLTLALAPVLVKVPVPVLAMVLVPVLAMVLTPVVDIALLREAVAVAFVGVGVEVVRGCGRVLVLSYAASTETMEERGRIIVWMWGARLALTQGSEWRMCANED